MGQEGQPVPSLGSAAIRIRCEVRLQHEIGLNERGTKALGELRERADVRWTHVSPAGGFQAEGEHTGRVRVALQCGAPFWPSDFAQNDRIGDSPQFDHGRDPG